MSDFIFAPNAPLPTPTLTDLVTSRSELSTTAAALAQTGLDLFFNDSARGYTLFAPTDDAWQALPSAVYKYLMANTTLLSTVLQTHACMSRQYSSSLTSGGSLSMLSGQYVQAGALSPGAPIGLYIGNALVANVSSTAGDFDVQVRRGGGGGRGGLLVPPGTLALRAPASRPCHTHTPHEPASGQWKRYDACSSRGGLC
jgi:hypothetical protein